MLSVTPHAQLVEFCTRTRPTRWSSGADSPHPASSKRAGTRCPPADGRSPGRVDIAVYDGSLEEGSRDPALPPELGG
ncbi:hypothetical protein GCM10010206_26150 [Streptomyces cinerochromogenes]|nr:hypothetical protein GCM10010206_26150 [Streptomyces cinerochromogenes]